MTSAAGGTLRLPSALADVAGGRTLVVDPAPPDVAALLDAVDAVNPALARRIRDETGSVRRFVNVYVDDEDVRFLSGLDTATPERTVVSVVPAVAGG